MYDYSLTLCLLSPKVIMVTSLGWSLLWTDRWVFSHPASFYLDFSVSHEKIRSQLVLLQVLLPKGYGFVLFKNPADAVKAQIHLNEVCIVNLPLLLMDEKYLV